MIKYILIYPAVGKRKIGPVEMLDRLEDIVWDQAAKGLVKVIAIHSIANTNIEYHELIPLHRPDYSDCDFKWSPLKDLSIS